MANPGETTAVSATRVVPAPLRDVWDAVVSADRRQQWWPGFDFEARIGGEIDEAWRDDDGTVHHTRGTILRVDDPANLEFEWIDEGWKAPAVVSIQLIEEPQGTRGTVRESGLAEVSDEPGLLEEHQQGWELHLRGLADYLKDAK